MARYNNRGNPHSTSSMYDPQHGAVDENSAWTVPDLSTTGEPGTGDSDITEKTYYDRRYSTQGWIGTTVTKPALCPGFAFSLSATEYRFPGPGLGMNNTGSEYNSLNLPASPKHLRSKSVTPLAPSPKMSFVSASPPKRSVRASSYGSHRLHVRSNSSFNYMMNDPVQMNSVHGQESDMCFVRNLTTEDYDYCTEVWSLSSILNWLDFIWETNNKNIPTDDLIPLLSSLIASKIPTLNPLKISDLAIQINKDLHDQAALIDIWYPNQGKCFTGVNRRVSVSGIFTTLTGNGCYGHLPHLEDSFMCYSPKCSIDIKTIISQFRIIQHDSLSSTSYTSENNSINSAESPTATSHTSVGMADSIFTSTPNAPILPPSPYKESTSTVENWATYWNLTAKDLLLIPSNIKARQLIIFEFIQVEQKRYEKHKIFINLYGESFKRSRPPLIHSTLEYWQSTFGNWIPIMELHKKTLLDPLIHRREKEGKFIQRIGDLLFDWIEDAEELYLTYTFGYSKMIDLLTIQKQKYPNSRFMQWITLTDKKCSRDISFDTLVKTTLTGQLLKYCLMIENLIKATDVEDYEYQQLETVLSRTKKLSSNINRYIRIGELVNRIHNNGYDLKSLDLFNKDRAFIAEGDLYRKGSLNMRESCHVYIFDNCVLICQLMDESPIKVYRLVASPIPTPLMVVEIPKPDDVSSDLSMPSSSETPTLISIDLSFKFPFKIRHLGRDPKSYTFDTKGNEDRNRWTSQLMIAKKRFSQLLNRYSFEPFKLQVISDYSFKYSPSDIYQKTQLSSNCGPLNTAIETIDHYYLPDIPKHYINSANITCSAAFTVYETNHTYTLFGFQNGIFMNRSDNIREWRKIMDAPNVWKIEIVPAQPGTNVAIILYKKTLVWINLEPLVEAFSTKVPVPLSNLHLLSKQEVYSFGTSSSSKKATSTIENSEIIFMKKKSLTLSSSAQFREIIPTVDRKGDLHYIKNSKNDFSHECDCYGISVLKSSIALYTSKGFEIVDRKTKQLQNMPNLNDNIIKELKKKTNSNKFDIDYLSENLITSATSSISVKPIALCRLSKHEFLLCYDEFAIFCNQFMIFSRPIIIKYLCKANSIGYIPGFLIIAGQDILEVRRIVESHHDDQMLGINGVLKQIITGKGMKIIENKDGVIKILCAHPRAQDRQLVAQLVSNDKYNDSLPNLICIR